MAEPNITALARRLAEQNNVDWRDLQGTGPDGLVVEGDVLDYLARVMAGDEALDPTPEPVPEGLESWPEQDARGYLADEADATGDHAGPTAAAEDGGQHPTGADVGGGDDGEVRLGDPDDVTVGGWRPNVEDVLADAGGDGVAADVVDDVLSDVGAAWAAVDAGSGDAPYDASDAVVDALDTELVVGADSLEPDDVGLSQDIFIFDDENGEPEAPEAPKDTGFDLLVPDEQIGEGASEEFDLDARPLDGFGEEFTTAAERYWTGGDDLVGQSADTGSGAGDDESLFADDGSGASLQDDDLFTSSEAGADDALFGLGSTPGADGDDGGSAESGEPAGSPEAQVTDEQVDEVYVTDEHVAEVHATDEHVTEEHATDEHVTEEDPGLFDVRSFLNDDGTADADGEAEDALGGAERSAHDVAREAVEGAASWAGEAVDSAQEWVGERAEAVSEAASGVKEWAADQAASAVEHGSAAAEAVGGFVSDAAESVGSAVESVVAGAGEGVAQAQEWASERLGVAAEAADGGDEDVAAQPDAEPVVDEPVVDEPVADEPVVDEPVADEPVVVAAPPPAGVTQVQRAGSTSAPFLRLGSVIRRRVDLTATVASLAAAGTELGSAGPLAPTPFLLRAAAKAARDVGGLGGEVALAELGNDLWFRRVDDAATIPVRKLVEELATAGTEEDELGLIVVDLSSFDVDELLLGTEQPALSMGRILMDSETGTSWCTLALSGSLPVETGAALLARVAELLESPTRLLL